MGPVSTLKTYRRLSRAQSLDREAIQAIQAQKLRSLVRSAYQRVPYYRTLFEEADVSPDEILGPDDLVRIPITTKAELREARPASLIDGSVDPRRLTVEMSSGSTGAPFSTYYDQTFRSVRNLVFLRGLKAAGYRLGDKLLLVTSPKPTGLVRRLLRWRYASIEDPAAKLWEELRRFAPDFIYGCVSSLRMLAEEIIEKEHPLQPLRGVITTAETLDAVTRELLSSTFGCAVFDFYGMSEMGLVGWECSEHRGYHVSEDTVLLETIPLEASGGRHRLVMTNLESAAMPFIRYDSGDIALPGSRESCPCGSRFSVIGGVEGRLVDCVRLRDGRRISPYMLTCRLERLPGIARYRVVQEDHDSLTIRVRLKERGGTCPSDAIREAIGAVVGSGMSITVEKVEGDDLPESSPGRRARVVESRL
jgi:phenylacetate-CoA ligase